MNVTITPNSDKVISILLYNDKDYIDKIYAEFNISSDDKRLQFLVIIGYMSKLSNNAIRLLVMIGKRGYSAIGHLLMDEYNKTFSVSSYVYYTALNELLSGGFVVKDDNKRWLHINSKYTDVINSIKHDTIIAIHF